jgi:thiamine monophosphate synthase
MVTPGGLELPGGLVLLTDRRLASGSLIRVVARAIRGGAAWVILRERDLPYAERRALAITIRDLLPPGRLIVAGPDPLGADAVHLSETDPLPAAGVSLVGRSCHGAPELSIEDYATLSPIYPTESKPGYGPALGPSAAAALAGETPWLALGGIDSPDRAAACAEAGARGIAVMGAIMRAPDPEAAARTLASAFGATRSAVAADLDRARSAVAADLDRARSAIAADLDGTHSAMVAGDLGSTRSAADDLAGDRPADGDLDAGSFEDEPHATGRPPRPRPDVRSASAILAAGSARPIGTARPAGAARPAMPPAAHSRGPAGSAGPR